MKRGRESPEKIDALAENNARFCKYRDEIFKDAEELCRLDPSISVHAVLFSPDGIPFTFGDPLSILSTDEQVKELLAVDISTLNKAERESYGNRLRFLRDRLLAESIRKRNPQDSVPLDEAPPAGSGVAEAASPPASAEAEVAKESAEEIDEEHGEDVSEGGEESPATNDPPRD